MSSGVFLIFVLAMFAFMYVAMIRPQRVQQRRHTEMLAALKPGDEVVTAGGIYGEVKRLDADRVALEVDDDVEIVVAKRSIASVVPPEELEPEELEEPVEQRGATTAEPEEEAEEPSRRA